MTRLADSAALLSLQNFIGYHLGEQHHSFIDIAEARACPESAKIQLLPLIFGLMPIPAAFRKSPYIEVKPIISRHLAGIEVEATPLLIGIIKDLCDNFDRTRFRDGPPALRTRKSTISDLRAQPELYKRIRQEQGSRCAVCGSLFGDKQREETLDHVIPWRLGGDPPGGWNWQLLCRRCNNAKDTLVAAYATPEFSNWVFPDPIGAREAVGTELNERGRYLALRHFAQCQAEGCSLGPKDTQLFVVRRYSSGFSVLDHLTIRCASHAGASEAVVG